MEDLLKQVSIKVDERMFLKNPESSSLGKSIITGSIQLINEIGVEEFTFKKLSIHIGSPESSIYRYFENKNKVLLYLTSWYWCWLEYRLVFSTINIIDSKDKLKKAVELITQSIQQDSDYSYIDEVLLNQIVIAESSKLYHTKEVDSENKDGLFKAYKRLVQRVSEMVLAVNPNYKFPHMLISTVIEGANQQKHFAKHLPSLTDVKDEDKDVSAFFTQVVFNSIIEK